MLAIFSNSIENADKLSDGLQSYWNARGVYTSVSLFESKADLLSALLLHLYECIILERVDNPLEIVSLIQEIHPSCKIAVVTDNKDSDLDNQIALGCLKMGVCTMLTQADFELPLAKLSQQLQLI